MRAAFGTGKRMTVSNWTGDVNLKIVIFDFVVFLERNQWSVACGYGGDAKKVLADLDEI